MFVYCDKCGWEQDDFWDEMYNPIACLQHWQFDLLSQDLDEVFVDENGDDATWRQVFLREMQKSIKRVVNMEWRTLEELDERNPDRVCPIRLL